MKTPILYCILSATRVMKKNNFFVKEKSPLHLDAGDFYLKSKKIKTRREWLR